MTESISFARFWAGRDHKDLLLIDRAFTYQISIFIAFLAYRMRVTPNQLSIGACCLGTLTGISALFLDTENAIWSIMVIYGLAQSAYILDCADGQLARCTNQTSAFGAFLDHGLDIFSATLAFGGFFAYLYRYYINSGDPLFSNISLFVGFYLILSHTSRFFVSEKFIDLSKNHDFQEKSQDNLFIIVLKSLIDHQFSLFTILIFLISPIMCFVIFALQASFRLLAYFRYFLRAYRLLER